MLPKIKKEIVLIICTVLLGFYSFGQEKEATVNLTADQVHQLYEAENNIKNWMKGLQTPGVLIEGNQMKLSKEAQKLLTDSDYRKEVYKDEYTFLDVKESLMTGDLQKAFWQMINMYPKNKETVLKYIYAYDSIILTDKIVVGSFYTYAYFDPKITTIAEGKPIVHRPDILEEDLRITKEIVTYIAFFREEAKKGK